MAHDDEEEKIIERHRNDDAQEHRLPTVGKLLIGKELGRGRNFDRNLDRSLRFYPNESGDWLSVRRHQEDKVAMVDRAAAERQGVAGVVGLDQLAIEHPVH